MIEMKMNDATVETIMSDKNFIISATDISNKLGISLFEAKQELITDIFQHRHVLDKASGDLTAHQKAHINFSKKDVLRNSFKVINKEAELFTPDTNDEGQSVIDLNDINTSDHTSFSKAEIQRAIAIVPDIFDKRSAGYVIELLTDGEKAFRENHAEMDNRMFNRKMKGWLVAPDKKRQLIDSKLFTDRELKEIANRSLAQSFLDMVEQGTPDEWFTTWFEIIKDNEWFDEAFDFVEHPKNMIEHWDKNTQARKDGYEFISELRYLIAE